MGKCCGRDYNRLIRENRGKADGFLDLDEVVRKPEDFHFMRDDLHMGDGVHPNASGGLIIAEAIARKWFCRL